MNLNWIFFVPRALATLLSADNATITTCQKPEFCVANDTIYDIADVADGVQERVEAEIARDVASHEAEDSLEIDVLSNFDLGPTSTPPAPLPIPSSPLKDRFNHASADCAAVILQSTPNSSGASSILS